MEGVTTSEGIALRLSANDTVLEARTLTEREERLRRIREIGEAIERGVYRVPSSELADAILRAARCAN